MNRNTYTEQKERAYSNKWKALQYKGAKCQTCGEDRPATLCFHHRDPSQKELRLDGRSFANRKWDTIKEEVDKCDLLCHNCHHIVHYGNSWGEFLQTLV
jgi:predicted HNH restriction endonuclease